MPGHGRPKESILPPPIVALATVWALFSCPDIARCESLEVTLRMQWFATTPHVIDANLLVENAHFGAVRNLSLDPGSTGGLQISEDAKSLAINSRSPALRGGVDFELSGQASSLLKLRAASPINGTQSLGSGELH